jgi:hypothetical protein
MGYGYPAMQPQMQFNGMAPQQMPKRTNFLTDEEIKKIQANRTQFTLTITEDEHLRAACNHRTADGTSDALEQDPENPNGCVCRICGQKFVPIMDDSPQDYVQGITNEFCNILQTIKLMFVDLPADAAKQFFDIIPLAQKTPELFSIASKNLAKYDANIAMYGMNNQSQSAMGLLSNLMNMVGSGAGFGFQGQPMYQQQPMMGGGTPNPAFGGNAFGYPGASQYNGFNAFGGYGYQPQMQGYQYTPGAPQAAPTADPNTAAPTTDTTSKTVNVQA